jgi:PKD repeat protein
MKSKFRDSVILLIAISFCIIYSCTKDDSASNTPKVSASFTVDKEIGDSPLSVKFTNTSSNTTTVSYNWNFGDGTTSTDKEPTHSFTNTSYTDAVKVTVALTVTGVNNITANSTKVITVNKLAAPPRSSFASNWLVNSKKSAMVDMQHLLPSIATLTLNSNQNISFGKGALPNLEFYKRTDWAGVIVIKSKDNNGYDNLKDDIITEDDDPYIYFTFGNITDVDITKPFDIGLLIDNKLVTQLRSTNPPLQHQYISWAYKTNKLSPGQHTVTFKLDYNNEIEESNETDNTSTKTITVASSGSVYKSFDLLENRYFIIKTDGTLLYGKLKANLDESELYLDKFGTLKISSVTNTSISFSIIKEKGIESVISATREPDKIKETDMTKKLRGMWQLVETTSGTSYPDQKWGFYPSGIYMFEHNGYDLGFYPKIWDYVSETQFKYGFRETMKFTGESKITLLTAERLEMTDLSNGNIFKFNRLK